MNADISDVKQLQMDSDAHHVTFTVTVATAIPICDAQQKRDDHGRIRKTYFDPKGQSFYHTEYTLLPNDLKAVTADIAMLGTAAKIVTEEESRFVHTWEDGGKLWVAWTNTHPVSLTLDILVQLYNHKLSLEVCKSRDKVMSKARFEKPVVPKSLLYRSESNKVKELVVAQLKANTDAKTWTVVRDKRTSVEKEEFNKNLSFNVATETKLLSSGSSRLDDEAKENEKLHVSVNKCPPSADQPDAQDVNNLHPQPRKKSNVGSKATLAGLTKVVQFIASKKTRKCSLANGNQATASDSENMARVAIDFSTFFAGVKSVTSRSEDSVKGIEDVFMTLSLDGDLMSEAQRKLLNPLTLKVLSLTSLPSQLVVLNTKGSFACISYKFCNQEEHFTKLFLCEEASKLEFSDIGVALLGVMSNTELCQCLMGPPLQLKIRHVKMREADNLSMALTNVKHAAGGPDDVSYPVPSSTAPPSVVGVAKLSLSDLFENGRVLEVLSQVEPVLDEGKANDEIKKNIPRPYVDYFKSGTMVKITAELAYPLDSNLQDGRDGFNRIILLMNNSCMYMARHLVAYIKSHNFRILGYENLQHSNADEILSQYGLSSQQLKDTNLDVFTGFHVFDTEIHIVAIEGIRAGSMGCIIDKISECTSSTDSCNFSILYNSKQAFQARMHRHLCGRSVLFLRLREILSVPLFYVRGVLPGACLGTLLKVQQLSCARSMREVCRNNLLPTEEELNYLTNQLPSIACCCREMFLVDSCTVGVHISNEEATSGVRCSDENRDRSRDVEGATSSVTAEAGNAVPGRGSSTGCQRSKLKLLNRKLASVSRIKQTDDVAKKHRQPMTSLGTREQSRHAVKRQSSSSHVESNARESCNSPAARNSYVCMSESKSKCSSKPLPTRNHSVPADGGTNSQQTEQRQVNIPSTDRKIWTSPAYGRQCDRVGKKRLTLMRGHRGIKIPSASVPSPAQPPHSCRRPSTEPAEQKLQSRYKEKLTIAALNQRHTTMLQDVTTDDKLFMFSPEVSTSLTGFKTFTRFEHKFNSKKQ